MTCHSPALRPVLLLNNRTAAFYEFEALERDYGLLPILVMNRTSYDALPSKVKEDISHVHILELGDQEAGPTFTFPHNEIVRIFEEERKAYPNLTIVGADEMSVLVAARVREQFGLPGTSLQVTDLYRHKIHQKQKLQEAGVRVPRFVEIDFSRVSDVHVYFEVLKAHLGDAFIVKPALAVATVGVTRVHSAQDLESYKQAFGHLGACVAESFIEGQLHHVDLILHSGHYVFEEVCEYVWNGLSFVSGKNHGSLMLNAHNPLRAQILDFARKANAVLGLTDGCVHMELFVTAQEEIIFLEAGPRPAGSLVPYVYAHAYERCFMNATLVSELGIAQEPFAPPKRYGFWGLFPKKHGRVTGMHIPNITSPHTLEWVVSVGDDIPQAASISEKAGHLSAFHTNYAQLHQDFVSLRTFQALTLS